MEKQGDADSFDKNWRERAETGYMHWIRGEPINQVQLAFQQHWRTFSGLLPIKKGSALEVGCGRGSLSAYFSDAGWDTTLLDISETAVERAKAAFSVAGLKGNFDVGDCMDLPYAENSFDLVFSVGLLEHFEDFKKVIAEQHRVLKPGGYFIGYVVPESNNHLQAEFSWVNELLMAIFNQIKKDTYEKHEIFRSDATSSSYIPILKELGFKGIGSDGIYSMPMISYSPEFPFTLLPAEAELILVREFSAWIKKLGQKRPDGDGWRCDESQGNAFLVWGEK